MQNEAALEQRIARLERVAKTMLSALRSLDVPSDETENELDLLIQKMSKRKSSSPFS